MDELQEIINYSFGLSLLYVEDNEFSREATIPILEEFFGHITVAVDGQDGFEKFQKKAYDIVISDINMPKLDGLQMTKKIKEGGCDIPVLILSSYNESKYFKDSIKLGVDGYLHKPIEIKQFMDVLGEIIGKLKKRDKTRRDLDFLSQYQEAIDKSSIVSKTDLQGLITYVNSEFCKISEYTEEELIGKNHNIIRHPSNSYRMYKELWDTIKNKKKTWQGIMKSRSKSGKSYYVKTVVKPIFDEKGEVVEYIALRNDITNIMNPRRQLNDFIHPNEEYMVIFIKIAGFDDIERFYGNRLTALIEDKFSERLFEIMPNKYKFERIFPLGDGEFVFIKNRKEIDLSIRNSIRKLRLFQEIVNDTTIEIDDVDCDLSIIISFACGKGALDNAKYGLKELIHSKQSFIVANDFVSEEYDKAKQNLKTLKMIKKAIDDFRIVSYFQPIINNKTKKVAKYESLVRLIDEDGKVLTPYHFLDVAKKGQYYTKITSIVLENSFNALKYTDMDISINLSALDIEKKSTRDKLYKLLEIYRKDNSRVVFELLEDEDIKDFNLIKKFIKSVKNMGVKIAIDDFGTGYSNFERLLDYQPDILKIDGSLIKNIENDKFSLSVVKTIVAFAKEQNIKIVAEFVENEKIFNILNVFGIDYSQGYYFGKPEALKMIK